MDTPLAGRPSYTAAAQHRRGGRVFPFLISVRVSTSFTCPAGRFLSSTSRYDPIGHRPIRKEKGTAGH
jgi:hypothetical protein